MTTKERGDVAVGFAVAHFLSHQYEVCLPIGDKRNYDFVIEKDNLLLRVQVKYAGLWKRANRCLANLRVMGGNQSFHSVKTYSKNDFDLLFVHTEKGENYLFPWPEVTTKTMLTVEDGKYRKYRV